MIDIVTSLYTGDKTKINVNGEVMGNMEVRNDIRQGCTGSPQPFLMVINVKIKKIMETGLGFRWNVACCICICFMQMMEC